MRLLTLMTLMLSLLQVNAQIITPDEIPIVPNRVGNGGGAAAVEISYIARNISTYWEDACHKYPSNKSLRCELVVDYKKLWEMNSPLKVSVIPDDGSTTAADGSERDLYNDGVSEIIVNDKKWQKTKQEYQKDGSSFLVGVIFHEFITILGEEQGDNYTTSMNIIAELSAYGYDFDLILTDQFLPKRCSINTQSNDANYHNPLGRARYDVKIMFACKRNGLKRTCILNYTKTDNFIINNKFETREVIEKKLVSEKRIKETLLEQVLAVDNSCL